MIQRGSNFMLAKFQEYCFTSWRLSNISFHPNNAPENLKSQKIHKNRGGELRMVPLSSQEWEIRFVQKNDDGSDNKVSSVLKVIKLEAYWIGDVECSASIWFIPD